MIEHYLGWVPLGMKDGVAFGMRINELIRSMEADGWQYDKIVVGDHECILVFEREVDKTSDFARNAKEPLAS